MADSDPEPDNSLSPYYPAETPTGPGNGRTWFAVLVVPVTIARAISLVL